MGLPLKKKLSYYKILQKHSEEYLRRQYFETHMQPSLHWTALYNSQKNGNKHIVNGEING